MGSSSRSRWKGVPGRGPMWENWQRQVKKTPTGIVPRRSPSPKARRRGAQRWIQNRLRNYRRQVRRFREGRFPDPPTPSRELLRLRPLL